MGDHQEIRAPQGLDRSTVVCESIFKNKAIFPKYGRKQYLVGALFLIKRPEDAKQTRNSHSKIHKL